MEHRAIIVGFAVDKGGVGKTTTAINTVAGLARRGKRVLAVDVDQQANLSRVLLNEPTDVSLLASLLDESVPLPIVHIRDNLDLVPASHKMFGIGIPLITQQVRQSIQGTPIPDCRCILKRLLGPVREHYDYIILDCPPSDNIMTINAMYAADYIFIVAEPEPFCVEGVVNFGRIMRKAKNDVNKNLRLGGVLITNYEMGSVGHKKGEEALRAWGDKYVCTTRIRHSRPLYNASLVGQDIFTYAPSSIGAVDYNLFVNEFILRVQ